VRRVPGRPPFTVLHVCVGNICRSPMAERLLRLAVAESAGVDGEKLDELLHSHSAGTGGWHAGEPMNPPAARQVLARGGDDRGFAARALRPGHVEGSDLILCATAEQRDHVVSMRPEAAARAFVLGEFGRLLRGVDPVALPPAALTPLGCYTRGAALVAAVDAVRGGAATPPADDLSDPWGHGDQTFARVADEIERTVRPLAALLVA
jgi:protein-tyrosine phosphatase